MYIYIRYKYLVLLGKDEKDHCPGRMEVSFFEKVELHWEEIQRSRNEGEILLGSDFGERNWL